MLKAPNGIDLDVLKRLQAKLDGIGDDDILDLLQALDASDAGSGDKRQLAGLITGSLGRRDPALALDVFIGRISDNPAGALTQLGIIYGMWAAKDVTEAAAWFDRQVSEGTLSEFADANGRAIDPRAKFESLLVRALAGRDPDAAAARFDAMPEAARRQALRDEWFSKSGPGEAKAVADFLREWSGGDPEVLASAASMRIRQGDLDYAAAFLNALEPTREERSAIAAEALRRRIVDQLELRTNPQEARDWILEQAPHDADRLTGTVLGQFVEWHDFSEMSRLALGYRDESGSDAVLAAFLKSAPDGSRDEILTLAAEITDPALREEIVGRFTSNVTEGRAAAEGRR